VELEAARDLSRSVRDVKERLRWRQDRLLADDQLRLLRHVAD
jgi:hypothetical protein